MRAPAPKGLSAKAERLLNIALVVLNVIFFSATIFLVVVGSLLGSLALKVHIAFAVVIGFAALGCEYFLYSKKSEAVEILDRTKAFVGRQEKNSKGRTDVLRDLLKSLVESGLSSAAGTFIAIPVSLGIAGILLVFIKYYKLAMLCYSIAAVVALLATCVYFSVRHLAFRQVDRLVSAISGQSSANGNGEDTPLLEG